MASRCEQCYSPRNMGRIDIHRPLFAVSSGQFTPTDASMFQTVALVGATGAVGRIMRDLLEQRGFQAGKFRFLASARSAGSSIQFRGQTYLVEELTKRRLCRE